MSDPGRRPGHRKARHALTLLASALATALGLAAVSAAEPEAIGLTTHRIPSFQIAAPEATTFGSLRWRGGLEVEATSRRLGGLSGLIIDEGGDGLLAISDDGQMLRATIERDSAGRPIALSDGRMRAMQGADGQTFGMKQESDTESIDVLEGPDGRYAYVSMEARPRIVRGRIEADGFIGPVEAIRLPEDMQSLRWTKGLESLAVAPAGHPLAGAVVVIAERALHNADTNDRPGWIVGGPKAGRFDVADDGYDITDAKFGPGGDLYVLERLFNLAEGVRTRVRRIAAADLVAGAMVRSELLMEGTLAHQIDNMEGLAIWRDGNGRTVLSLLSDDNRSFLQRTLYLEFELVD